METILKQGEDALIEISLGEPVEEGTLVALSVILLSNDVPQKTYHWAGEDPEGDLTIKSGNPSVLKMKVSREDSKGFSSGRMKAAVLIENTNEDFPENKHGDFLIALGRISKSFTKSL